MSADLNLLPSYPPAFGTFFVSMRSPCLLTVNRDVELFQRVKDAGVIPLSALVGSVDPDSRFPFPFSGYSSTVPDGSCAGERCYGPSQTDAYGDPLFWMRAKELADLLESGDEKLRGPETNSAIAYLRAWPPSYPVVLYWC